MWAMPERAGEDAPVKKRVLVAGLFHQTNTIVRGRTSLEDFEIRRGQQMLRSEVKDLPLAGLIDAARQNGWELLPVVDMRAASGATVADAVVDLFWAEFRAVADREAEGGIDGIFLVVHGSMVSESLQDVEGEILRRLRGIEQLSDAPICGVMDLHANFTEAMARQSDGLIAYRENPPMDMTEAASLAATILDGLMQTEDRPATVWDHPPIMWTPSGTATDEAPMLALEDRGREIEAEMPDLLAVNVLAGFPYADVPDAGVSFSAITAGDLELARAATRELNVLAASLRAEAGAMGMPLEEAMLRLEEHDEGPVLLVEPSDGIEAGAPGENTHILRAFVERDVEPAGVILNDPLAVEALRGGRIGEVGEVVLGGKSGETGAEPLCLEVELVSVSDGRFAPESRRCCPTRLRDGLVDMGSCAVVKRGGIVVLLTSRRTPPFDLGQWRSQGVEPEGLSAIGVKAAVEHRRAYGPIAGAEYVLDLPGPCDEDLRRLPFENVSRPIYPLDEL